MSFYTNHEFFGGFLKTALSKELLNSKETIIASGYVSNDTINDFKGSIYKKVKNGHNFNLIIGMAFFEGLSKSSYKLLKEVHTKLQNYSNNQSGIRFIWTRRYHGKIYYFKKTNTKYDILLGSSNFSRTGLETNLEASVTLTDRPLKKKAKKYLSWLLDDSQSRYLDKIELLVKGTTSYNNNIVGASIKNDEASRFDVSTLEYESKPYFDIKFDRINKQEKSSLNVYFGKGRLQRSSGKIIPRNWYEGEIIVDQNTARNPLYPKGEFTVITDDGFLFMCKTQSPSSNFKNFRSLHDLSILGKWIKLKLQNAGALEPLTPVTSESFDRYGLDYIRVYKLSDNNYFLYFPSNN